MQKGPLIFNCTADPRYRNRKSQSEGRKFQNEPMRTHSKYMDGADLKRGKSEVTKPRLVLSFAFSWLKRKASQFYQSKCVDHSRDRFG